MEFSIKGNSPDKAQHACIIVGIFEAGQLTPPAAAVDRKIGKLIERIVAQGDFTGKSGTSMLLHAPAGIGSQRVLLVGLGKEKEFCEHAYYAAIRHAFKAVRDTGAEAAHLTLSALPVRRRSTAWKIRQAAIAALETAYRFDSFKSQPAAPQTALRHISLAIDAAKNAAQSEKNRKAAQAALAEGLAIAEGMALAKNLANTPGNVCTPSYLADAALQLADEYDIDCQILECADMEQLGMNALLSVTRGSQQPPKFIVLHYRGQATNNGSGHPAGKRSKNGAPAKPLVLIGKGITFDSGGISLKPGEGMDEMKFDMCGAASVLGALKVAILLRLPVELVVLVPTCENMPGGNASKPGDIVTSMSGQTIEILNTDAEGRLILCDALTYAKRFKPDAVIDVATLTGACIIALGHAASGLFANDEALASELLEAGETALDRAWQLPLWADYREQLKSNFADMANIGGRPAGSITAACFLSRFAEKFDWAHLDVAGTAWKSGADKGATGRPVPLLAHYLLQRAGRRD